MNVYDGSEARSRLVHLQRRILDGIGVYIVDSHTLKSSLMHVGPCSDDVRLVVDNLQDIVGALRIIDKVLDRVNSALSDVPCNSNGKLLFDEKDSE